MNEDTGDSNQVETTLESVENAVSNDSTEIDATEPSLSLVEVAPGLAVAFGEVPDGVNLGELGIIPDFDRAAIANTLGALGNAATISGNIAHATESARGLYRLSESSFQLLKNGGHLAAKDGANLGAIFNGGKVVAQARFVPVSTAGAALVSVGPAIAMMALQMKLNEVTGLLKANLAVTTDTLKTIRRDQWTELEGLAEAIEEAMSEARDLDTVTESIWDPIAGSGPVIRKQLKLYRAHVSAHIDGLSSLDSSARRQFLETHAEAIAFDSHALLTAVKAYGQYQALRAALARVRSVDDSGEAQLFNRITNNTPAELKVAIEDSGRLIAELTRELRIIAELPGRIELPLTKKRRDSRSSRLTCAQLLDALEPLADSLRKAETTFEEPQVTCMPEGLNVEPYLRILRWHFEQGETLRAVAFGYESGSRSVAAAVPSVLSRRVDSAWNALEERKIFAKVDQAFAPTLIAVTDRRVLTTSSRSLLQHGIVRRSIPLPEVQYVRRASKQVSSVRPTVDVITEGQNMRWIFPAEATDSDLESLAEVIENGSMETRANGLPGNAATPELSSLGLESME